MAGVRCSAVNVVNIMMALIADETDGRAPESVCSDVLSDEMLTALYRLSKSHDLAHLVGDVLIQNGLIQNQEIRAKFEKQMMMAVFRYEQINYELNRLREAFNQAEIPFIPLKGAVIRKYYPQPWMRTSCDIDILVHEADLERAVTLLTGTLAYREDSKGAHDVGLYAESGVHLELHYCLSEDASDGILDSVWERCTPLADLPFCYVMPDDLFYYYHIAHMAKHFQIGGCGVRPFVDLRMLNRCHDADRAGRQALLETGGLAAFSDAVNRLSAVWFDGETHTDLTRQMEQFLLSGGVYGTTENRVTVQQVKKGGKLRYAISRIWLPYEELKFHYPSLEGKRYLLLFYEIRRWGKLIFCGGAKRSVRELKLNAATSKDDRDSTTDMLIGLGLK